MSITRRDWDYSSERLLPLLRIKSEDLTRDKNCLATALGIMHIHGGMIISALESISMVQKQGKELLLCGVQVCHTLVGPVM